MLAAAAALGAGLLPGRAALKQCSGSVTRVALQLQERAEPARKWASSYDLATEEVTIEEASSTAGPLEAYETAENPAEEGAVPDAEERAALILLPDASGWQGEGVRSLADRRAAPPQRAPPLPLPLPAPLPLQLTPHAPVSRQACHLLRLRRPAARPAAYRAAVHRSARQRGVPGTPHVCTARMHCMCTARMRCTHALACALHVALHVALREHCVCTAPAQPLHSPCTAPALRLHCPCTAPALRLHQAWLSGVPAARVEADVRTCIAYLRADRLIKVRVRLRLRLRLRVRVRVRVRVS